MNCPVCKCPNPPGATHCSLCYEVFHRSAADTFMRAARRDRQMREQGQDTTPLIEPAAQQVKRVVQTVDWGQVRGHAQGVWNRGRLFILSGLGLFAGILFLWIIQPGTLIHNLLGTRLVYRFSSKTPTGYLVGFKNDLKSWSERNGRLDTPIEEKRIEEIGNVTVTVPANAKGTTTLRLSAREWIQIVTRGDRSKSLSVPLSNPSLLEMAVVLDKKGRLATRPDKMSPRVAAGSVFIFPIFPVKKMSPGHEWREAVQWVETVGDYKIAWRGDFRWRMEGQTPYAGTDCEQLSYRATLQPQIWAAPGWVGSGWHQSRYSGEARGIALYDPKRKRLVSNTLERNGTFRIPMDDVGRIPDELRIGRYVRGRGDLLIHLQSKIEVREN